MFAATDLLDLAQTDHADLFADGGLVWEVLRKLDAYIAASLKPQLHNRCLGVAWIDSNVSIGEGTVVEDGVMIKGPAIIGRNCELRHNAYIRGNVILGDGCVVGNSSEVKHSILLNNAVIPHFNYVGDSILGYKAHLGAGAKICNVRLVPGSVKVEGPSGRIDTNLRKFGAIVGDYAEVGCNATLNPGSVLGRRSVVYPNVCWRGTLAAGAIAKNKAKVDVME